MANSTLGSSNETTLGGSFTFPGTSLTVHRMGYGAMQLAGPGVFGPPRDRAACLAVLRAALEAGVNHIDTSDFYGPHVTNQIIKEALHPYPENLVIVTKVGAKRGPDKSWVQIHTRESLVEAIHDNLRNLGLDVLDVVNLRASGMAEPSGMAMTEPMEVLAELQQQGLIKHIGLSNVNAAQFAEAEKVAPVVCVQNMYNVAHRKDDAFIDELAAQGVAYVPFFPLGGFSPLQSSILDETAKSLGTTPAQTAQAWLLHHSPNILLIPGTSSVTHLHENLRAAAIELPADALAELDSISTKNPAPLPTPRH